jgi:hypothetical protein
MDEMASGGSFVLGALGELDQRGSKREYASMRLGLTVGSTTWPREASRLVCHTGAAVCARCANANILRDRARESSYAHPLSLARNRA